MHAACTPYFWCGLIVYVQAILGEAGSEFCVTFARALSREVAKEWDVVLMRGGIG
jgi:hypothetical protein